MREYREAYRQRMKNWRMVYKNLVNEACLKKSIALVDERENDDASFCDVHWLYTMFADAWCLV